MLIIGLLVVGSGWTWGGWSSSTSIYQQNYGNGNYRDNYADVYSEGGYGGSMFCWGCYAPPPPCPPPPPPPCWSCPDPDPCPECPDPDPDPDPEPEPQGKCKGIKTMTLKYIGDTSTTVEVKHKGNSLGTFNVAPGESFTVTGENDKKGKLHADVTLKWDGQEVKIHTSCSKPIDVGDIHGDFEITDLEKVYKK